MTRSARILLILLAACTSLLAGCRSPGHARRDGPAVLVNPDARVATRLHDAVSTALGGRQVMIAPDALTKTDLLIIEPAVHRTLAGREDSGRIKRRPEKFHLLLEDSQCILVQDGTKFRALLKGAHCRSLTAAP